jgi:glycosyltransferase involved in cell wall biosynthesis
MKISVLSFDMGHNCLGRAYLLAKVLQRRYHVEILGSQFPAHGEKIWGPCDTGEFNYITVKGSNFPDYFSSVQSLLKSMTGDVIYASKLRMSSYGVALLKKISSFKPVVLDIDDLETSWFTEQDWKSSRKTIANPIGPFHTKLMEKLVWAANDVTTVSSQLQKRFGGVIVPHGKNTDVMDPAKFDREQLRTTYGLSAFKVIMFLGTPRPHKGLEDVVHALKLLNRDDVRFVVVGKGSDLNYEKRLQELGGEKVVLFDMVPFSEVPKLLAAADMVVLPQRRIIQAEGQIPAKLFDAMAMAKPIVATDVSDLAAILGDSGLICEPEDHRDIADKISWMLYHPQDAAVMGQRAREKCIQEYSWNLMEDRLSLLFDKYKKVVA